MVSRVAALSFAGLVLGNSSYLFFWPVALPTIQDPSVQARSAPGGHREGSSCRCLRCAGPTMCPCDHGTPSQGSVCGSSHDERPLSAQDAAPPVPAKMMCDVPHPPSTPEVWTPRFEWALGESVHPLGKPIDKVPIL